MSATATKLEEIYRRACPWKPDVPEPAPELLEKLDSFFDEEGDLTVKGWNDGARPGIFVASIPPKPKRRKRA